MSRYDPEEAHHDFYTREEWERMTFTRQDYRNGFLLSIEDEVSRAYQKHGTEQWSRHEAYGIIKEEFDEFWLAIMEDEPQERVYEELIQVAAMCLRYYETRDRYREPQS